MDITCVTKQQENPLRELTRTTCGGFSRKGNMNNSPSAKLLIGSPGSISKNAPLLISWPVFVCFLATYLDVALVLELIKMQQIETIANKIIFIARTTQTFNTY